MNFNQQAPQENGQSPGCDPKTSKRNSGLFSFFKWFKPSVSRESIDSETQISHSSSCDSLNSIQSNGTVASFSYIPPSAYSGGQVPGKCLVLEPETDTYKARLKQRDKRRENDKNLTLRKKYNLFFNRETLLKTVQKQEDENTKSLPLMTRTASMELQEEKMHRRTNSESSKLKKAGAYLHVKGKRRAPQPPGVRDNCSTSSLRRKKRLAPPPPAVNIEKVISKLEEEESDKYSTIEYAEADVICNDSLKLDHGILKPAKGAETNKLASENESVNSESVSPCASPRSSYIEQPVSPRPWYKRNSNRNSMVGKKEKEQKVDNKYEPVERLPEVSFMRNSTIDLTTTEHTKIDKKKDEKRKSGLTFLTNISELDREACEIIKKEHSKNGSDIHQEMPEFMRPKEDNSKINTDSWVSPKRRSARDLIAKFNAITNVTKVTVNSAFFGGSQKEKRDYFGRQISVPEERKHQEALLESHRKRIEKIDNKLNEDKAKNPLMKSESTSAIKHVKPETPKSDRKSWNCPKCSVPNEYWRIICHVCSSIKPYFDDLTTQPTKSNDAKENKDISPKTNNSPILSNNPERFFERSKTQIGFSALASYNQNRNKAQKNISSEEKSPKSSDSKKEERERLKKMLIEMKNSLPKRKSNALTKQNSRTSVIMENPENNDYELKVETRKVEEIETQVDTSPKESDLTLKTQEQKVAEILIGTRETIYENIKVKKTDNPKPIKVSASAQTSSVVKKIIPEASMNELLGNNQQINKDFELMKPKDFENIYSDSNSKSAARIYANLARNDELSLFFNVPKKIDGMKSGSSPTDLNTDTIEINRLLRRLESAISKGDMVEAALFAKELAQLKVNCSVIRQKPNANENEGKTKGFSIEMYVEDKVSHRGPLPIQVTENQTLKELKQQIEREFEIPANVQRWILGKELATNDQGTLKDYNITTAGCPVFLYLVAPESKSGLDFKTPSHSDNNKRHALIGEPSTSAIKEETKQLNQTIDANKKSASLVEQGKHEELKSKDNHFEKSMIDKSEKNTPNAPKVISMIPKVVESISKQQQKLGPKTQPIPVKTEKIIVKPKSVEVKPVILDVSNKAILNIKCDKKDPEVGKMTTENVVSIQNKLRTETKKESSTKSTDGIHSQTEVKITVIRTTTATGSKDNIKDQNKDAEGAQAIKTKFEINPKQNFLEGDDYDTKTLKPQQIEEWECHLCTLLNPITSNICAVCATVRLMNNVKGKKPMKKKAPQPTKINNISNNKNEKAQTYQQLVNLDNADLVENSEQFECVICFLDVPPGRGITLRECLHQFCKECLAQTVEFTEEAEVKCPYRDDQYACNIALQDREVKSLVTPAVYEKFLARSVAQAENKIGKSFHCKSPDCKGWCIFEDNVNDFLCPVCNKFNCLTCQAIHMNMNCKQYQEKMNKESEIDDNAKRTKEMLEEMVTKGEAIACPTCQVILMKKWGCDWLRCSMCKTEICWVTRGPRWGPAGKGDTSGGCQCGVNGVKCHPQCNYCH